MGLSFLIVFQLVFPDQQARRLDTGGTPRSLMVTWTARLPTRWLAVGRSQLDLVLSGHALKHAGNLVYLQVAGTRLSLVIPYPKDRLRPIVGVRYKR